MLKKTTQKWLCWLTIYVIACYEVSICNQDIIWNRYTHKFLNLNLCAIDYTMDSRESQKSLMFVIPKDQFSHVTIETTFIKLVY
jgi:hypothetical protein